MTLCQHLLPLIEALDVRPSTDEHEYKRGGYHSYYSDKKEEFSIESQKDWQNKQKNVYKILAELQPKTVLDLGANRGWFSRLAQHLGASVTATDIDESCMDEVYTHAQENKLPIMSAIIPFEDCKKTHVSTQIKSDVVLCLALIHHLVFVAGFTLEQIFENLAKVTGNHLILEYIDWHDSSLQKGIQDPTFFKNESLHKILMSNISNYAQDHYKMSELLEISMQYFSNYQIYESHPNSRKLILFTR
jgi:cyclopropane fatty-acyl-phospholipid synthase-like methyltransferase